MYYQQIPPNEGIVACAPLLYLLILMSSYSPDAPGAIQAKLAYLRLRKAALDELILSLERYSVEELPARRRPRPDSLRQPRSRHLAGAA